MVAAEHPDAVIIAAGSTPIMPEFKGIKLNNVLWVGDACRNVGKVGKKVLIVGAGNTGAETALSYTKAGKNVTVVDIQAGAMIIPSWTTGLERLLKENGAKFMFETGLSEITADGAIVKDKDGREISIEADTVILSLGFRPHKDMIKEFSGIAVQTYVIGDNNRPNSFFEAARDGYNTAFIR